METEILADHPQGKEPGSFRVHDFASANWVVRKIIEARNYGSRVKVWAELEQRRAKREEEFLMHRFGAELETWVRQQIAKQHDRRRSVSLPAGAVGFRTEQTRLSVVDEIQLINWCREHLPSALRVIESVAKSPLMDHLKTTGECPEGTEICGGGQRFYISAKKFDFVEGDEHELTEKEGG